MKIISIFNNKGGVGKTTLTYHLANILAEMGKKVLILDLDSQCNISLYGMKEEQLEETWKQEEAIIENGFSSVNQNSEDFKLLFQTPRTTHFLLKTVEEGISDFDELPPPFKISDNLDLIPGRLTLFMYENKIAERWTGMFLGEPLSIRTVTKIRKIAESYTEKHGYDFVIIDTSPNLGALNKVIISTVDGFIIPCLPDMFSLYGIKNIGKVLTQWQRDFEVCFSIISDEKRKEFPEQSVKFLGHTLYKAKKGSPDGRYDGLAKAHYNYAKEIPTTIKQYIHKDVLGHLSELMIKNSIGDKALMLSHNSLPNMAQKYKKPMWLLPAYDQLEASDKGTIRSKRNIYEKTREMYEKFAKDFLIRVETLDE